MNNEERLQLKKLVNQADCEDNTEYIRKIKQSSPLREDIITMQKLKRTKARLRTTDPSKFEELCQKQCNFLYSKYTDIFHKLLKDELNMEVMSKLLDCLKKIEDGQVDQHEGAAIFSKLALEMYRSSAVIAASKNENNLEEPEPVYTESKPISWKEYKDKYSTPA
jgi:flagellar biosynthesis component FlhA